MLWNFWKQLDFKRRMLGMILFWWCLFRRMLHFWMMRKNCSKKESQLQFEFSGILWYAFRLWGFLNIRIFDFKVYLIDPAKAIPNPKIPLDFFKRTAEEIKREQQQKTEAIEQMTTLKTQRMRELDSKKQEMEANPYKYTYIRIRFPNNYMLQVIPYIYLNLFIFNGLGHF